MFSVDKRKDWHPDDPEGPPESKRRIGEVEDPGDDAVRAVEPTRWKNARRSRKSPYEPGVSDRERRSQEKKVTSSAWFSIIYGLMEVVGKGGARNVEEALEMLGALHVSIVPAEANRSLQSGQRKV
jgi:hypothetical protein